ncbi:DUF2284 domain-containing protein [Desulfosporosinus sp. FKB]|uniref:DUF2284 domain-containing protein n=1 Tax=Desulfosporosinus sp. FKB TaxID=1969835 RepID=UPI00148271DD|nr:DUF2284 domain-containing protein [Desulfosporosinus sp. FKB]
MNPDMEKLTFLAKSLGAAHAAIIDVAVVQFNEDFRTQCEQNVCGSYNKNWMCPPAVGSIAELKEKVQTFKQGLLFQTVYQLEGSFDWEGMQEGTAEHTRIFRELLDNLRSTVASEKLLPLNVGPCTYCGRCAFLDNLECRFPEEAVSSVEASGIDVIALEKSYGIPYNNGENTISCVSLILVEL